MRCRFFRRAARRIFLPFAPFFSWQTEGLRPSGALPEPATPPPRSGRRTRCLQSSRYIDSGVMEKSSKSMILFFRSEYKARSPLKSEPFCPPAGMAKEKKERHTEFLPCAFTSDAIQFSAGAFTPGHDRLTFILPILFSFVNALRPGVTERTTGLPRSACPKTRGPFCRSS